MREALKESIVAGHNEKRAGCECACCRPVRERPIIFNGDMVRAILDGRKTQTRRLVKLYPQKHDGSNGYMFTGHGGKVWRMHCPFGHPGDRLWAREAWRVASSGRHYGSRETRICVEWREQSASRGAERGRQHHDRWVFSDEEHDALMRAAYGSAKPGHWRPSIHMPRWASRLTLEITSVRVERLQDISEEDAIAEGITGPHDVGYPAYRVPGDSKPRFSTARAAFGEMWRSIYGVESWEANPWVWAITFRRVTP